MPPARDAAEQVLNESGVQFDGFLTGAAATLRTYVSWSMGTTPDHQRSEAHRQ